MYNIRLRSFNLHSPGPQRALRESLSHMSNIHVQLYMNIIRA